MNKKIISWALYDWANSVFYTTVMAGFFPVFFKKYWSDPSNPVLSTERLGWILSISGFALAVLAPVLGVLSDQHRSKKKLLFVTMLMGALSTMALYFVPQGDWQNSSFLYGFALFMCSASCIFYDSLMVSVCKNDELDFVSALGFGLGYLSGALLFTFNVVMYLNPAWFGLESGAAAVKFSFLLVGIWWVVFTVPLLKYVPEPAVVSVGGTWKDSFFSMTRELNSTFLNIVKYKNLFYFIVAYWFYIDGVFTVMSMAVDFGLSLGFESSDLLKALLITNFLGFPASIICGKLAKKFSNQSLIIFGLAGYIMVIGFASLMSQTWHFMALATMIGIFQGPVQSLSRSLFAQLIPGEKSGEYFGFFNLLGKFASVLGPMLVALFAHFTENSRLTILSLMILITIGIFFLSRVRLVNQSVN